MEEINIKKATTKTEDSNKTKRGIQGTITAVHRERYEIILQNRRGEEEVIHGRVKPGIYYTEESTVLFPTVGDLVEVDYNETGHSFIVNTLPRKSYFSRLNPTPGMGEQVVAANFDYVFITMSLNADFNVKKLERYVTAAWQSGGTPVVILTKVDLYEGMDEELQARLEDVRQHAPGVEVYATSSVTGEGMEEIKSYLKVGNVIVFLGSSGVGKSTFVNALFEKEMMKTGDIREVDSRGRHTTTHRELFCLPTGAYVIDTPGMRELGMWDVSNGLGQSFADIEVWRQECRFSDCTHTSEPGCAVRQALEEGKLDEQRWNHYNKLKKEARYTEQGREGYLRDVRQQARKRAKHQRKEGKF